MQPFLTSRNRRLYIKIGPLVENKEESTILGAAVAAGASTITVANINKFAVNKILLIGEPGEEKSEIIKTHASSAPSGTTVTLASNTVYAHPAGTSVYIIEYDQVELSHATTVGGSKTNLTTTLGSGLIALEADELNQVYRETEFTTGYYYARFKNSIGGTFGDYTDAVAATGFPTNTIGYIIDKSLRDIGVELDNDFPITWFFEEANDCIKNIQGKLKRMAKYQSLNTSIGQTSGGMYNLVMPSDIYDTMTNRSLIALRIGDGSKLRYMDPIDFEELIVGRRQTTVATEASANATSLVLTDTDDLPSSGSIDVWVSNVKYTITYTGITRGSATLTGIPASGTGSISVTLPVGSNVYQGANYGAPTVFTVRNGYIEFECVISESYIYKNIYADYWTVATEVNSETDEIDADRYDMVLHWMLWKLRCKAKNEGKLDLTDGDYLLYKESLNDFIRTTNSSVRYPMRPKINGISYHGASWKRGMRGPTKT